MINIREKKEEKRHLIEKSRGILDKAEAEGRTGLEGEEKRAYDAIYADIEKLDNLIEAAERQLEVERGIKTSEPAAEEEPQRSVQPGKDEIHQRAFEKFLTLRNDLSNEEQRALVAGVDTEGGYIVSPQEFVKKLIQKIEEKVYIRQLATVYQLKQGDSLGVPTLDEGEDDAEWTPEIKTSQKETDIKLGKRELKTHGLSKLAKVSRKLLRVSAFPIENLIIKILARKFARAEEKAFMTGDGNEKPLGVFIPSSDGIPESQDKTGAITFDTLIDAVEDMSEEYDPLWIFRKDVLKKIRKLKDNNGQYIWEASVKVGEPDRILGLPYKKSKYIPQTVTVDGTDHKYWGILGDFSYYWIADSLQLEMQRLVEKYATENKIGFIGRKETDAMPVLAEAFIRLKEA